MEMANKKMKHTSTSDNKEYNKLLLMTILSFIAMYLFMYSMINSFDNFYNNVNQFYMAGLMVTPMIIIELLIMGSMYMNKKRNALLIGISLTALIAFYVFIRQQTAVSDKQFLKGMIPHHAAAILMAGKSSLQDPEVKALAQKIIIDQQAEIEQMKAKLKELDK